MFDYNNPIVRKDMDFICRVPVNWERLNGKSVLVTGANGMIATYLVYVLMHLVLECQSDIRVIALVRNKKKAEELFGAFLSDPHFVLLEQDICDSIVYDGTVDYIFHCAGNASPYFIEHDPVGIMSSNLIGTFNVLEMARKSRTQKVIFASTREVYGENRYEECLAETSFGTLDPLENRACYPESKRAAETLCKSYFLQYGVDFNTVRIAHSYGPGMKLEHDGRVMADLMACVVAGRDIVLKSTGEALRAFCYVADTVLGLFRILLDGASAEAYNLANEAEETSIRTLAEMLVGLYPEKHLKVVFQIPEVRSTAYCNYKRVKLDVRKIETLGWQPLIGLKEGIIRTIESFDK